MRSASSATNSSSVAPGEMFFGVSDVTDAIAQTNMTLQRYALFVRHFAAFLRGLCANNANLIARDDEILKNMQWDLGGISVVGVASNHHNLEMESTR